MKTKRKYSSLSGKAASVKKGLRGILKASKRKVKLKTMSNLRRSAVRMSKKSDSSCVSSDDSSREETADLSPRNSASFAPLILDSPTDNCSHPAFSIKDIKVKVSIPHIRKVKQVKRKRSTSCASRVRQSKELKLFPIKEWGLIVAVLPHPACVKFHGPILIQVISGSVKILGFVLDEWNHVLPAFSYNKLMPLDIKTESTDRICEHLMRLLHVRNILVQNNVPEDTADKILDSCDNSSVIVGFRRNLGASHIYFASSLMPSVFLLKNKKKDSKPSDFTIIRNAICSEKSTLQFPQCENFIHDVISTIEECAVKRAPAPRVVVQGSKGLGKSTFLRYSINRILNKFDEVYYLDGDLGQSEFTPAGCVSLVKVTSPLLGAPFTHQTTPEKMYFLGTVAVQEIPENYIACVELLAGYYNKNCSAIPLFVNTMGYVYGMGLELLEKLKSCILPTHVVKLIKDFEQIHIHIRPRAPPQPICSTAKEFTYERFAPVLKARQLMNPAERRELSILAYLGKCQKPHHGTIRSLNSITPYCIYWKDLALYIKDQNTADHIFYAFNGAWVALLSVDESLIMVCGDPLMPKFLSAEPFDQECCGFGVVRGIDIDKKAFYIITPEHVDRLKNVNAIVKSNVQLPSVLLTSQDISKQIPYVIQAVGERSTASKHVNRRKFRPNKSKMKD